MLNILIVQGQQTTIKLHDQSNIEVRLLSGSKNMFEMKMGHLWPWQRGQHHTKGRQKCCHHTAIMAFDKVGCRLLIDPWQVQAAQGERVYVVSADGMAIMT